jgi:hypothetical protein
MNLPLTQKRCRHQFGWLRGALHTRPIPKKPWHWSIAELRCCKLGQSTLYKGSAHTSTCPTWHPCGSKVAPKIWNQLNATGTKFSCNPIWSLEPKCSKAPLLLDQVTAMWQESDGHVAGKWRPCGRKMTVGSGPLALSTGTAFPWDKPGV